MWFTLLVMAVAVSLEPFRIAMTVVMLNRPRPALQLAVFLCGGLLMGLSVGGVALFAVANRLPASPHFTLPTVQITVGVLALVASAVAASGAGLPALRGRTLSDRVSRHLNGSSLWVAALAGLGIALPSLDYLAALAVIVSGTDDSGVRLAGLLIFTVVAFATVEIPLLACLMAPRRTRDVVTALHGWIRGRGRRGVAVMLAVVGVLLLTVGLSAQRGGLLSTYCAPASSCDSGSEPPPKAAWVAGAVTSAGS